MQKTNLYALKISLNYLVQSALEETWSPPAANAAGSDLPGHRTAKAERARAHRSQCSAILTLSGTREHGRLPVRFLTGPLLYYTRVAVLRHGNEWEFRV